MNNLDKVYIILYNKTHKKFYIKINKIKVQFLLIFHRLGIFKKCFKISELKFGEISNIISPNKNDKFY